MINKAKKVPLRVELDFILIQNLLESGIVYFWKKSTLFARICQNLITGETVEKVPKQILG